LIFVSAQASLPPAIRTFMTDLLLQPAGLLLNKLRARVISSAELVSAALARIDALNPKFNAFCALDGEAARAAARASDARLAGGDFRPLEGLPIDVKDTFDVVGFTASAGAPALKDRRPDADAPTVARLRAAGAVILGKTNVPVFASDFQTFNPLYGVTSHPQDPAFSPGGSSGGAAVAVATGMSALSLASDLGGSIRWPAHACGLFGLKPTWGLATTYGTMPPPPSKRLERDADCLVAGPLARSAEDLKLMLEIIAGPRHGARAAPLPASRAASAKGLRVALWAHDPFSPTEASVRAATEEAARRLEAMGARIDEAARPGLALAEAFEVFALYIHAALGYGLPAPLRDKIAATASRYRRGDLSHRALQSRGVRISPGEYRDLGLRRLGLQRQWAHFFERYDVVLSPPAPVGAIRHDFTPDFHQRKLTIDGLERPFLDILIWSALASGPGLPAAVAPVGLGPDAMPRGVQIIAPMGADLTAIAVAAMIGESAAQ
jgi:amidase